MMPRLLIFLLIASLMQGTECNKFGVNLPQTVKVMRGSCVTVSCSFDIEDKHEPNLNDRCEAKWIIRSKQNLQLTETNPVTGDLTKKNCTTTFSNMQPHHSEAYNFRLHCKNALKYTFDHAYVTIEVTDNFPSPTLTPPTLKVKEGDSVSLKCSAPAPCLPHPPILTWTPAIGDTQWTLQENQDKTLVKTSVLSFTASHLHHGQNISCTAVYKKQDESSDASFTKRLIPDVLYTPKNTNVSVSPSGPVQENSDVTLTCSSNANPAVQNYTWYGVNGGEETVIGTGRILNIKVSTDRQIVFCKAENDLGEGRSNFRHIHLQFPARILLSSQCTKTATQVNCSCETEGNPSPMIHWHLNGRFVNQSSQVVINEYQNCSHLRSIITMNEPQDRDMSLICFSVNCLGSASKQFCVSCLESSRENPGQITKSVFITTITAFLLVVFALLFVVRFQKTYYKTKRIPGETGTFATGQHLTKEKNEVPKPNEDNICASFVEFGQSENVQPSSGTDVNCTSSLAVDNPEETSRSSGNKSEDVVYSNVIWSKKEKTKKEENCENMSPSGSSCLGEEKFERGGMHFVSSALDMESLYAEVKTVNVRKEAQSEYAQVKFKNK